MKGTIVGLEEQVGIFVDEVDKAQKTEWHECKTQNNTLQQLHEIE